MAKPIGSSSGSGQKEDIWSLVQVNHPFPDSPVKAKGEQNQYVALWYKHGKPICGRAWNEDGKVQCAIPYNKRELMGAAQLGGEIQILSYKGKFADYGFYYEWVPYGSRNQPHLELVRCGQSAPILVTTSKGKRIVGNLDMSTEKAEAQGEQYNGGQLKNFWVICRNLKDPGIVRMPDNIWIDARCGDSWEVVSSQLPVLGMGKRLRSDATGTPHSSYIALTYKHGQPLMGRCYNMNGKVEAGFGWSGQELTANLGSIQVLCYDPDRCDFTYNWQPFTHTLATSAFQPTVPTGQPRPLRVADVAPCVLRVDKFDRLGQIDLRQEKASAGWGGKEDVLQGADVQQCLVLCRNK